jgi:hypothetical protein
MDHHTKKSKHLMLNTDSQTLQTSSKEHIRVENNYKTISPGGNSPSPKWNSSKGGGLPDLGSSIVATQARIKRHITTIQTKRIQQIRAERNMNSARWSIVNKNPLGISSNRAANDSVEYTNPEVLNTSSDSMNKINLLSRDDVAILID